MPDDTTVTTDARPSIDDIAHIAVTDPSKLTPAQVTRLGDWILDHEAHVLAHSRLLANVTTRDLVAERRAARAAALTADGAGDVTKRLAGVDAASDTTEHTT